MAGISPLGMTGVSRRQLHVVLILDCSGSMTGDRMASLNYAVRTAVPELRAVAEDNPEVDLRMRAIRFASTAEWHIEEPTRPADVAWHDLGAGGESNLGEALRLLAKAFDDASPTVRQLPPVIVLVSDGLPTDDFERGLERFFASELADQAIRLGIAIGTDADRDTLQAFIRHPDMRPLRASNATDLIQHIKWATTAPVKAASSPTNTADPLATIARDTDFAAPPPSDIVW